MKFEGMNTGSTRVDDTPGVYFVANNPRLKVAGQMTRRLGMARSNLSKVGAAITLINGFALGQGQDFAIVGSSGQIDGQENPLALWGDASLKPVSGNANLYVTYSLGIARGNSQYMTSVIIGAQNGRYPTDANPGLFVDEILFDPWDTTGSTTWTPPAVGTWYFRAWPVREGVIGPGANLTNSTINSVAEVVLAATNSFGTVAVDSCSALGAYVTFAPSASTFAYGQALADGAITLPYVFTAGATGATFFFAFSNLYGGTGWPKPGTGGTITINADGSTTLV